MTVQLLPKGKCTVFLSRFQGKKKMMMMIMMRRRRKLRTPQFIKLKKDWCEGKRKKEKEKASPPLLFILLFLATTVVAATLCTDIA